MMKIKNNEKKMSDGLKALFVVVGAIVTVGTIAVVLYNVFKKFFKITVECEGDDEDYFDDFDEYDPVCSPDLESMMYRCFGGTVKISHGDTRAFKYL
ncbi:MAG: hypothetical protein IIZ35_03610, partial [Clostridia bacterium]|nr:hypothetical protein [Clostridia bacterium]